MSTKLSIVVLSYGIKIFRLNLINLSMIFIRSKKKRKKKSRK